MALIPKASILSSLFSIAFAVAEGGLSNITLPYALSLARMHGFDTLPQCTKENFESAFREVSIPGCAFSDIGCYCSSASSKEFEDQMLSGISKRVDNDKTCNYSSAISTAAKDSVVDFVSDFCHVLSEDTKEWDEEDAGLPNFQQKDQTLSNTEERGSSGKLAKRYTGLAKVLDVANDHGMQNLDPCVMRQFEHFLYRGHSLRCHTKEIFCMCQHNEYYFKNKVRYEAHRKCGHKSKKAHEAGRFVSKFCKWYTSDHPEGNKRI